MAPADEAMPPADEAAAPVEEVAAPKAKRRKTIAGAISWRPTNPPKNWDPAAPLPGKGRRSSAAASVAMAPLVLPELDGPTPEDAAALYAALAACVDALKARGEDAQLTVHGWELRFKTRSKAQKSRSSIGGDIRLVDPADGVALSSMLALKRKLGLVEEGETSKKHVEAATAPVDEGPRQSPPPPPPDWVWPHEGEKIEVEIEGVGWVSATVAAVLTDSWFSADIAMADDAWTDWFTWQEEGVDWRRKKGSKKAKASKAEVEAAEPTGKAKAAEPTGKAKAADGKRKRSEGGDDGKGAKKKSKADGDGSAPPPAAEPPPLTAPKPKAMPTAAQIRAAKAKAALADTAARARSKNVPMVELGVVSVEMVVEVVQWEAGLLGSRYQGVVLELRHDGGKRKSGEMGGAPTEALVEYDALYDEPDNDGGGDAGGAGANGETLLREWVAVSALRPPPKPASPGWYKHLAAGAKAMVLYDGGWWDVLVSKKLPTSAKSGESQKFEIEPVGYDLKRKVDVSVMRPSVEE